MAICSYCRGPITGSGYAGRPWPARSAAVYCCYGCLSLGEQHQHELAVPKSASNWKIDGLGVRLGIGGLVVGQSMIFGLALNLHSEVPSEIRWFVQTVILVATLIVIALLGGPLFQAAGRELRRGRVTLEALFLLTMTGAMAASLQAHFTGRGKIYFEVVSILLVVYTLGKIIGSRSRSAALAASRTWAEQLSLCRVTDEKGRTRTVPVAEIQLGDVIEVCPGETIAVDGVIQYGTGFVSEAPVSGEPFAVVRRPGDRVLAGTASYDATFRIQATVPGTERQVDWLLAAVEQARERPTSFQGQADRLGRVFFPLIIAVSGGTFGYWTFLTPLGWEAGLFNAMSVLLVACPCVIGLATPIVIWSALSRLAERGLIVRAGDAIERLAEVDCVMLDKTGTLTDEHFTVLDIATAAAGDERTELLGWLSMIQERSRHPVARAFARLPRPFSATIEPRIHSIQVVPGCGIHAEIEETNGTRHRIEIGTPEWIGRCAGSGGELGDGRLQNLISQLRATGHRIDVAVDGAIAAVAILAEQLRDSVQAAIAGFQRLGLKVEVLTGDSADRAKALNLPSVHGSLLPADKLVAISRSTSEGSKPLFVGDGINDAAALAAAHAGIALASGTDLAVGSAPMTLYHNDLRVLPWAIELSREAVRAVRRSLFRALLYNLVGMTLAACGLLHPVFAALLMAASSLMLIFSSTRMGTRPIHCLVNAEEQPTTRQGLKPAARQAIGHGIAFALQGIAFLLLLECVRKPPAALLLIGLFAASGMALGYLWHRWSTIPHSLDMCVGMLSFGNLGMLLGWWADNDFSPRLDGGCSHCLQVLSRGFQQPWMWLGMLAGANLAMLWFMRCNTPVSRSHTIAMYTGGNLGMVVGMLAGGWCASEIPVGSVPLATGVSFIGMSAGMVVGMLLGTWVVEQAIGVILTTQKPTDRLMK